MTQVHDSKTMLLTGVQNLQCSFPWLVQRHSQHWSAAVEPTSRVDVPPAQLLMLGSLGDSDNGLLGSKVLFGAAPGQK